MTFCGTKWLRTQGCPWLSRKSQQAEAPQGAEEEASLSVQWVSHSCVSSPEGLLAPGADSHPSAWLCGPRTSHSRSRVVVLLGPGVENQPPRWAWVGAPASACPGGTADGVGRLGPQMEKQGEKIMKARGVRAFSMPFLEPEVVSRGLPEFLYGV